MAELTTEQGISNTDDKIIITHFINPQLFWYSSLNYLEKCAKDIELIESQLSQHFIKVKSARIFVDNARIILKYLPMQKFIRGEILHIVNPKDRDGDSLYIVWAVDYGVPIYTEREYMSPLPDDLAMNLNHIQRGGLAFLLPANMKDGKMYQCDNWDAKTAKELYKLLKTANSITFLPELQSLYGQNFGNLYFTNEKRILISVAEYLLKSGLAIPCISNFHNIIKQLAAPKMYSWFSMEGEFITELNQPNLGKTARCQKISDLIRLCNELGSILLSEITDTEVNDNIASTSMNAFNRHKLFRSRMRNLKDPSLQTEKLDMILDRYDNIDKEGYENYQPTNPTINAASKTNFDALKPVQKSTMTHVKSKQKSSSALSQEINLRKLDALVLKDNILDKVVDANRRYPRKETSDTPEILKMNHIPQVHSSPEINSPNSKQQNKKLAPTQSNVNALVTKNVKLSPNTTSENVNGKYKNRNSFRNNGHNKLNPSGRKGGHAYSGGKKYGNGRNSVSQVEQRCNKPEIMPAELLNQCEKRFPLDYDVIIHTNLPQKPINKISQMNFIDPIPRVMQELNITSIFPIQRYAWPHLVQGNSMVAINNGQTGRTWSYLPVLCTQIVKNIDKPQQSKSIQRDMIGPIAIILAANTKRAQVTANLCTRLMSSFSEITGMPAVISATANETKRDVCAGLLAGCGILVTTLTQLQLLVEHHESQALFNAERLRHLIFDDIDMIHNDSNIQTEKIIIKLFEIFKLRKNRPQIILIAKKWIAKLMESFLLRIHNPLLIFGDFLSAAIYGKMKISVYFTKHDDRLQHVLKFLKDNTGGDKPRHNIIFCQDMDEASELSMLLQVAGYDGIIYKSNLGDEVAKTIQDWQNSSGKSILICSDTLVPQNMQNAHNLIHYSMANTWTGFKTRFITLAKNFHNLLQHEKIGIKPISPTRTLIFIEDNNEKELLRLVDFLSHHKINLNSQLTAAAETIKLKLEQAKVEQECRLCSYMLTFGVCTDFSCVARHLLGNVDLVNRQMIEEGLIPIKGQISFIILKIYSPIHFGVRLMRCRSSSDADWQNCSYRAKYTQFLLDLNNYTLLHAKDLQPYEPPVAGKDICLLLLNEQYHRVRIMRMYSSRKSEKLRENMFVQVQMMDTNTDIFRVRVSDLFHCPTEFCALPPLAINLRLHGLVPTNSEFSWQNGFDKLVSDWLEVDTDNDHDEIQANIDLSLSHTIFVDNLILMERLSAFGSYIFKLNLKKELIDKKIAMEGKSICQRFIQLKTELEQHQTSLSEHDTTDNDTTINTSVTLYNSANTSVSEEHAITANSFSELATLEDLFEKQITLADDNETVDEATPVPPHSKVSTEPYENWASLPLNELTRVEIANDDCNGQWSGFCIFVENPTIVKKFEELLQHISAYMHHCKPACVLEPNLVDLGGNYILKQPDGYSRVKLTCIVGGEEIEYYQFMYVDQGDIIKIAPEHLKCGILYQSTEEIIKSLPFQVIYCRLSGIRMRDDYNNAYKTEKSYLYAYAVREIICDMVQELYIADMHVYEIILFASDFQENISKNNMLNRQLVDKGYANYDENTKKDLDIDMKTILPKMGQSKNLQRAGNQVKKKITDTALEEIAETEQNEESLDEDSSIDWDLDNCSEFSETTDIDCRVQSTSKQDASTPLCDNENLMNFMNCMTAALTELEDTDEDCNNKPEALFLKSLLGEEINKNTNAANSNGINSITEEAIITPPLTPSMPSTTLPSSPKLSTVQSRTPLLTSKFKYPLVTWYQTSAFIYLNIEDFEQSEYLISCDESNLFYTTVDLEDQKGFHINLCGLIRPEHIFHQKRGFYIFVKLLKYSCGIWPSLLFRKADTVGDPSEKLPWLKYDLSHANESDELGDGQQILLLHNRLNAGLSDDQTQIYEQYNNNSDDDHLSDSEFDVEEIEL